MGSLSLLIYTCDLNLISWDHLCFISNHCKHVMLNVWATIVSMSCHVMLNVPCFISLFQTYTYRIWFTMVQRYIICTHLYSCDHVWLCASLIPLGFQRLFIYVTKFLHLCFIWILDFSIDVERHSINLCVSTRRIISMVEIKP